MFNIGLTEWIFLAIIALLVIGPDQLPKMAQAIGQSIYELKRVINSFKTEDITKNSTNSSHLSIKQLPKSSNTMPQSHKSKKHSLKSHKETT